ncbi:MAG: hypothetical protein FJ267_12925 [Planctomycetes bacterium]|nr:hypothetical protein [Planctomycetota bacterium]
MIPGAIVAACLCELIGWSRSVGIILALGAVGVGLGGQETYGLTIGLLRDSKTVPWGLLGLTIKGAAWGLSGGAIIGMAFMRSKYRWHEIAVGLVLLLGATVLGRFLIDEPRLFYFSFHEEKPREEIWAGLTLGGLILVLYLMSLNREFLSTQFAVMGTLFGALGFGGGSLFLAYGATLSEPYKNWPWWKMMEFSFGAMFGLGLGVTAFLVRDRLRNLVRESGRRETSQQIEQSDLVDGASAVEVAVLGAAVTAVTIWLNASIPHRASYSWLVPGLILLSLLSDRLAWQVALSITVTAYVRDFFRGGVERG